MTRTTPGLLRLTALTGLAAFWLAVASVVAVLLSWPAAVVTVLAIVGAGALATALTLAVRARMRMRTPHVSARRRRVASDNPLHNAT
jgi:hypothetical protein